MRKQKQSKKIKDETAEMLMAYFLSNATKDICDVDYDSSYRQT